MANPNDPDPLARLRVARQLRRSDHLGGEGMHPSATSHKCSHAVQKYQRSMLNRVTVRTVAGLWQAGHDGPGVNRAGVFSDIPDGLLSEHTPKAVRGLRKFTDASKSVTRAGVTSQPLAAVNFVGPAHGQAVCRMQLGRTQLAVSEDLGFRWRTQPRCARCGRSSGRVSWPLRYTDPVDPRPAFNEMHSGGLVPLRKIIVKHCHERGRLCGCRSAASPLCL